MQKNSTLKFILFMGPIFVIFLIGIKVATLLTSVFGFSLLIWLIVLMLCSVASLVWAKFIMILLVIHAAENTINSVSEKLPSALLKAASKYLNDRQQTDRTEPTKNNERIEPKL
ncbi:hypothetical protein HYG89_05115 [Acinetobacter sp. SwsAc5]|uniref:hypothetical protein n=1 Tax=Acinetobacter sp. SwsAc5 TaxID=2749438 RepID=UPI0015B86726|nr:hypothetical protein [Acinetobacter sp. SwsAc5]NWK51947.1 hypothetical protein [Acinetobacter sp. SwsAc5]